MAGIQQVFHLLECLVSPSQSSKPTGDGTEQPRTLDSLLQKSLKKVTQEIQSNEKLRHSLCQENDTVQQPDGESQHIRWKFVHTTLNLLTLAKEALQAAVDEKWSKTSSKPSVQSSSKPKTESDAPPLPADTLSVAQQKIGLTALQFVTTLGIYPCLLPGVGVPLAKRSGFSHLLASSQPDVTPQELQSHRLETCVRVLLECSTQPSLGSLIFSRHLGDLLAALCQICYAPRKKKDTLSQGECESQTREHPAAADSSPASVVNEVMNNRQEGPDASVRVYFSRQLEHLLDHVYQPAVVRELLILQGAPPSATKMKSKAGGLQPSPPWLGRLCGHLLSMQLIKPDGVQLVLRGILQGAPDGTGGGGPADWKRCDAAARIIAHCPRHSVTPEEYYTRIAPQVLGLLHIQDKLVAKQFVRVAVSTIVAMAELQPALTQKHLLLSLLYPLLCCSQDKDIPTNQQPQLIVCEKSLTVCIEDLHKLCIVGAAPPAAVLESIQPAMHTLYQLYCFTQAGVSHLRLPLEEILVCVLRHTDLQQALSCVRTMTYGDLGDAGPSQLMHAGLTLASGGGGGVQVLTQQQPQAPDWESQAKCLVGLLKSLHRDELTAELFLSLLKRLTDLVSAEIEPVLQSPADWLRRDRCDQTAWHSLQTNLITLSLLANMCDSLGHSCFKSPTHILQFVQATLERGVNILKNTTDKDFGAFESETVTLAMGLLTAVLSDPTKISPSDREKSKELLPLLEDLAASHSDPNVQEMASDLRIAIATHGLLLSQCVKQTTDFEKFSKDLTAKAQDKQMNPTGESKTKKILEVDSNEVSYTADSGEDVKDTSPKEVIDVDDMGLECSYSKAIEELHDPLIPVRGHGLISLRKLIQKKDTKALNNTDILLKVFRENLDHSDSYIYLSSIQGLASLGEVHPDKVLDVLVEEYSNEKAQHHKVKRSPELRMKLGEVLVKTTRSLGDLVPHYRDRLLRCTLTAARDPDPHVRASAVSNLAELCKLLHFSLGKITHEIFECVNSLLKHDKETPVRQSAALVITMLLQGLGKDAIKVLDDVLRDLYHLLKHVVATEKDDQVLLHVHLALQELDDIMKDFLFPAQTLTKRIHVLDPPQT